MQNIINTIIDSLNIDSFVNDDIKIFFSDQNDKVLMENADSIPHNSIIFSSNANGNSILCKDNTKVRSFTNKINSDWFELNSDNKFIINETKIKEKINEYIINYINEYIPEIVDNVINKLFANKYSN